MSNRQVTIISQLIGCQQAQFSGRLDIGSMIGKCWKLYFFLGRLVWADGGEHPHRSWRRHLTKYCPEIDSSAIEVDDLEFECQNYQIIINLSKQGLKQEQIKPLVENKVAEVLFDIIQQQYTEPIQCTYQSASDDRLLASALKIAPALISVEYAIEQIQKDWTSWMHNGLMSCSLNLAPIIKEPKKLQEAVPQKIYQNFVKCLDGNNSLRDLAFDLNKNVLILTYSLLPLLRKGLLELVEITDLECSIAPIPSHLDLSPSLEAIEPNTPSIACIDDSSQICALMEEIITRVGYRYISIKDPLQAVPQLIAAYPDLIFLDIGMPILNGYEICTQLRRVSKFKETPIIMLTGHDGLVDRVRAKIVGASEFLTKPIEIEKILNLIEKYLSVDRRADGNCAIAPQRKIASNFELA